MFFCQSSIPLGFITIFVLFHLAASSSPTSRTLRGEKYLRQFGYLPPDDGHSAGSLDLAGTLLTKAVKDFQSFAGLDVTGEFDNKTVELMALPRCGVHDKFDPGKSNRTKRYAFQGSAWSVNGLTYKIFGFPRSLRHDRVKAELARAFAVWSEYTDLTFTPKETEPVDIEIRFLEGAHGDQYVFDGPAGHLAHAFYPMFGGDAHFDASEEWSIASSHGINLFQVAAHEFGHSLGLLHSEVSSALMAPFYRGFEPSFKLDSDDITSIQSIYKPNKASICQDPKIDAIFTSANGEINVFKGAEYYRLTENSIAQGYPKLISEGWPGLPGDIDAAFTHKNGKTFFFKGTKYWRYIGQQMDGDYPKAISDGFRDIPSHLDAAMVWGRTGKIYFFKGSKFWRFNPYKRPHVTRSYPKSISNWQGLPNDLDAAHEVKGSGYTYFFKGDKYYRFINKKFAVDAVIPPFPRSTKDWWLGCKS